MLFTKKWKHKREFERLKELYSNVIDLEQKLSADNTLKALNRTIAEEELKTQKELLLNTVGVLSRFNEQEGFSKERMVHQKSVVCISEECIDVVIPCSFECLYDSVQFERFVNVLKLRLKDEVTELIYNNFRKMLIERFSSLTGDEKISEVFTTEIIRTTKTNPGLSNNLFCHLVSLGRKLGRRYPKTLYKEQLCFDTSRDDTSLIKNSLQACVAKIDSPFYDFAFKV